MYTSKFWVGFQISYKIISQTEVTIGFMGNVIESLLLFLFIYILLA